MSATFDCFRIAAIAAVLSLGVIVAGCSPYEGDPGLKRSQQQSEELQNRIMTTQVDR
jgi:hypothetical protein